MDRFTNPDKTPRPERQPTADLPAPTPEVPTPENLPKPEAKVAVSKAKDAHVETSETRRAAPLVSHFGWRPDQFDFPVALVAPSSAALKQMRHETAPAGESPFLSQIEVLSAPGRARMLPRVAAVIVLLVGVAAAALWMQQRGDDGDDEQAGALVATATAEPGGADTEPEESTASSGAVDDTLDVRESQPGFGGSLPHEGGTEDGDEDPPTATSEPTSQIVLPGSGATVVSAGEGDSLITIAARFGLDVQSLVWSNDIEDPGATLETGTNVTVPQDDGVVHVVESGETVADVAARYGVEPESITDYPGNGLADGATLTSGNLLLVPDGTVYDRGEIATYTVREGDTLGQIAQYYGLDTQTLVWANELPTASLIHAGQELLIPPGDGALVKAADGESVDIIAARFSVEPQAIIEYEFNALSDGSVLQVNQWVLVPGDFLPPPDSEDILSAEEAAGEGVVGPATGTFLWPTEGWISQEFHADHNGLDVANDEWTPVNAADGGIVTFAGWSDHGLGYAVAVDHGNGYTTWYGHMAAQPYVEVGQVIWQGGYLGPMGTTGRSTGPHLHFILMKEGVYQNPLEYLD